MVFPYASWCWYIYHDLSANPFFLIVWVNVNKYSKHKAFVLIPFANQGCQEHQNINI
jgi:hypothetical protein